MEKKLAGVFLLFVLISFIAAQFFVPQLASATLTREIKDKAATNDVQLTLSSRPNALMCLGYLDDVAAVAHDAKLGEVYASELSLTGKGIKIDMVNLLRGGELNLQKADELGLRAIFSEENFRELLSRKVDKLSNVHVAVTPDRISMTAEVKMFGRPVEAQVDGVVVEDSGVLYFRMTRMNMKKSLFGRINIGNFFGDIALFGSDKLPFNLKIDDVIMQEGHVTVTAKRVNGNNGNNDGAR